ncbi:MAG TPA: alpha-ketoglutarate-dependent dioxygenase AlkB [Pyrinomonadaceae bacterium]
MIAKTEGQISFRFEDEIKNPSHPVSETLLMPDADVIFYSSYFSKEESDHILQKLSNEVTWRQDKITYYGKEMDLPRLTAWYGDSGKAYTYSNIAMSSDEWTPTLLYIKKKIEEAARVNFNSVLLNLYRNGRDGVSWHQDNEPELGKEPVIGSVSFGGTRRFQFRHKKRKELGKTEIDLTHGSLLIMKGLTQIYWQHQIPKTSKPVEPRINLTFRVIQNSKSTPPQAVGL